MAEDKNLLKEKYETLKRFLAEEHALVHLSPRTDGVVLPAHLTNNETVTLKLSHYFRGTVTQKKDRVEAELLFGSEYFTCIVPYDAIWGATNFKGQFLMWPESAPEEVLVMLAEQARVSGRVTDPADLDEGEEDSGEQGADADEAPVTAPSKRPNLARVAKPMAETIIVDEDSDSAASSDTGSSEAPPASPKRPHLRRVK